MFDPSKLLGGLLRDGLKGNAGLGGLGGGLGGIKGTVGLGLLGVAMEAFEHFTRNGTQGAASPPPPPSAGRLGDPAPGPPPPPGPGVRPPPPPPRGGDGFAAEKASEPAPARRPAAAGGAVLLVRAMIAAAAADGQIDAEERGRIMARFEGTGISEEERQFLQRELDAPAGIEELAAAVSSPDQALQVYAASLMAITVDSPEEASYLARLAARLRLDPHMVAAIRAQLVPGGPSTVP